MIRFRCGKCGATVQAPDAAAGRKGRCPQCGAIAPVPKTSEEAPAAEPVRPVRPASKPAGTGGGRGLWAIVAAGIVTAVVIAVACAVLIPRLGGPEPSGPRAVSAEAGRAADDTRAAAPREPASEGDENGPKLANAGRPAQDEATGSRPETEKSGPAPAEAATGEWDPTGEPDVHAVVFGSAAEGDADRITDMVSLSDNSLLVCGITQGLDGWAEGVPVHRPGAGAGGVEPDSPFVAHLSADLAEMHWVAVLPARTMEPTRIAVAPDGSIYLGGSKGEDVAAIAPDEDWSKSNATILKLTPDGRRLLWARRGGPNQTEVTGLAVDERGRVYWTAGTLGRSMAAYLLRKQPDGSQGEWSHEQTRGWCVDLHHTDPQLLQKGQFWWFYKRGWNEDDKDGYFDYDGDGGWAPVKFWPRGIRQGGQVVVLPGGDLVVSGTMQYDFQVKGQKGFPAFDLLLARYRPDGKLLWSTNLYRPNDSVHTPDQKAQDLHYDPASGDLYVVAWQHGSNQYRFKGKLVGDTGNMSIYWVGRVDAETGDLLDGWYFHNIKPGSNGSFGPGGVPTGWPDLSGNFISRVETDARGRVYVTGRGAPVTWATDNAYQSWPGKQWARYGFLYVLTPHLDKVLYATLVRGTATDGEGNIVGTSGFDGLAVTARGVYLGGTTDAPQFTRGAVPPWAADQTRGSDAAIVRFQWE
jgi:hypothetical protein